MELFKLMKKFLIGSTMVVLALSAAGNAAARENESRGAEAEINAGIRVAIEENKELTKEAKKIEKDVRKEEKKTDSVTKQKERIIEFWNKTKKRLLMLTNEQTKLGDRVDKKIKQLEQSNRNVTEAKAKMVIARAAIKASQDAIVAGDTTVADIVKNNEPKVALTKVRDLTTSILAKIKLSHKALVDAMTSLRAVPTPSPVVTVVP
jgi:chromosome segregation ATPase